MCGSDRPVSSKKKNTTAEWESCNLITALHWGETHGGGVVGGGLCPEGVF